MKDPFDYRRSFRDQVVDKGTPVNAGTLGYIPEYKDFPTTSWRNQFIARLKDDNKELYKDYFGDEKRDPILGNVSLFDGRPDFTRDVDNNLGNSFLAKYLQTNLVPGDDKITQVSARSFVEQDPKQDLANKFPDSGVAVA